MNEDGDETQPPAPPRGALAASTLRALRAGRSGDAPDTTAPVAPSEAPDGDQPVHPVADRPGERVDLAKSPVERPDEADSPVGAIDEDRAVEDGVVENTETAAPTGDASVRRARRGRSLTTLCAAFTAAALVFAVIAGVVWWTAGHSQQHRLGVARDKISTEAQLSIAAVNTSDYRHPTQTLASWLSVSTGSLHSQFSQSRSAAVKLLGEAKTVARANVLDEAVTSIDLGKGTADVIASVNLVRLHDGATSTVRNRYRATMTRVGGQWKLSNLTVVAVSLS